MWFLVEWGARGPRGVDRYFLLSIRINPVFCLRFVGMLFKMLYKLGCTLCRALTGSTGRR